MKERCFYGGARHGGSEDRTFRIIPTGMNAPKPSRFETRLIKRLTRLEQSMFR
jgi:hypothetical protein